MANNTWKNYTQKNTALSDNDEVMLLDSTDEKNKRGLMSKFWDYVVDKMSTAVISKLETENKTVIGAINALNSENTYLSSDFSAGRIRKFGRVCCALINNGNFTSDGHASFTIPENFCPAINTDFVDTYSKIRFSIEDDGTIIQKDTPYSTEPIRGYFTYMSTSN